MTALVVDEQHVAFRSRCSRAARGAAADHEHVDMPMLGVVAAMRPVLRNAPETREVAQQLLVQRPRAAGADHRAVVEADGREGTADLVGNAEQIPVERAENVLRLHLRARPHGHGAHADVRHVVDGHHAIRAAARAAEQTARPVILEAPREHSPSRCEERGADGVPREGIHRLAVVEEPDVPRTIDSLARLRTQPHQGRPTPVGGGISVRSTSFVRVSRSATNQTPHPVRWYHHSR